MKRTLVGVAVVALAAAPGAFGKGAAVSGAPPADPDAGETWNVTVRLDPPDLARHVDVAPAVVLRNDDGDTRLFPAKPTKTQGLYEAAVIFPSAGRWSYAATIGPAVDPPASSFVPLDVGVASDDSLPGSAGIAVVVAVALGLSLLLVVRRRVVPARA